MLRLMEGKTQFAIARDRKPLEVVCLLQSKYTPVSRRAFALLQDPRHQFPLAALLFVFPLFLELPLTPSFLAQATAASQ